MNFTTHADSGKMPGAALTAPAGAAAGGAAAAASLGANPRCRRRQDLHLSHVSDGPARRQAGGCLHVSVFRKSKLDSPEHGADRRYAFVKLLTAY